VRGPDWARPLRRVCLGVEPCCWSGELQRTRSPAGHLGNPSRFVSRPSRTASPTPSADEQNLRQAERAVSRFWSVIDRLSADPGSDLTELTTVSRGSVAAQWARNINQDRYDRVRSSGNVVVHDAMAKRSKKRNMFRVTACIDVSGVSLTDQNGKSVVPRDRPPRVGYNYVVEMERQNWYVVREKVTGTC
jgi:hypothetical protein